MKKDIFEKMLELDSNFRKFVDEQKDKTTEEIAREYGIVLCHSKNNCHITVTDFNR